MTLAVQSSADTTTQSSNFLSLLGRKKGGVRPHPAAYYQVCSLTHPSLEGAPHRILYRMCNVINSLWVSCPGSTISAYLQPFASTGFELNRNGATAALIQLALLKESCLQASEGQSKALCKLKYQESE